MRRAVRSIHHNGRLYKYGTTKGLEKIDDETWADLVRRGAGEEIDGVRSAECGVRSSGRTPDVDRRGVKYAAGRAKADAQRETKQTEKPEEDFAGLTKGEIHALCIKLDPEAAGWNLKRITKPELIERLNALTEKCGVRSAECGVAGADRIEDAEAAADEAEIERLARVGYAAYVAEDAGEAPTPWDALDPAVQDDLKRRVRLFLEDTEQTASELHEAWRQKAFEAGWQHGLTQDDDMKICPLLAEFEALPEEIQTQEGRFVDAVREETADERRQTGEPEGGVPPGVDPALFGNPPAE